MLAIEQAAVAVIGVLAEADVADDDEAGVVSFDRSNCALDDPVGVVGVRPGWIFPLGNPEEDRRSDAEAAKFVNLLAQPVDRDLVDVRHRGDLGAHIDAVSHEERVDEVARIQLRLADHVPKPRESGGAFGIGGIR